MTERLYADPNVPAPWQGEMFIPEFIGLNGYAQSGKDTTGKVITELYGHVRMSFADVLREALERLNPIVSFDAFNGHEFVRLREVVESIGWEEAKREYAEFRRLQQAMGTEVGRWLDPDIWVNKVAQQINATHSPNFVFTDCRFPNEARFIKRKGGIIVRIERPGVTAINAHESEKALDDWPFDAYLANDGAPEDLGHKVYEMLEDLNSGN
jgi:hypothetical protein